MNKYLLAALLVLGTSTSFAQIPAGYYDSAYNGATPKTCAELKTALFRILSKDTNYVAYNSSNGSYDSQDAVNNFDKRRNDANTADIIWDMYTDNPTGAELYTFSVAVDQCGGSFPPEVGACYNREHAYPRAWFGDDFHIRGDLHNVYATDGETNSRHANWPYAEVGAASWTSPAGAKLGSSSFTGYNGTVFEVIDEYKGDFARTMFYMVTAYEGFMPAWKNLSTADSVLDGTTWPSLDAWAIKQWYKWHVQDPVSQKELSRNDSAFSVQGNRNPFIDHPEYVQLIWSCTGVLPVALLDFTAVKNNEGVLLQWKAGAEISLKQYEVERSIDGITFTKVGIVSAQNKPVYNLTDVNLPDVRTVFYRLKMMDIDGRFTYSKTVNVKLNRRNAAITIFPNPAVNEITIALQEAAQLNSIIKVTDIAGKEVLRQKITAAQSTSKLKIGHLPAGRYFVFVMNNQNMIYDSFMIVK
jgi:endonuclease I